jgi:uncharacterized protein
MAETETSTPSTAVGAGSNDEKTWAMLCHLSALAGFIVPVPFINFIAPLIVWKWKGDQFPLVQDQGRESLNFQISAFIAIVICIALCFVFIGFILLPIVALGALILTIIAAIKASKGEAYRYPFAIRLVK